MLIKNCMDYVATIVVLRRYVEPIQSITRGHFCAHDDIIPAPDHLIYRHSLTMTISASALHANFFYIATNALGP